ncbi:MAG: peroxiredoxin-like family protein [Aureispira sp.]
MYVKICLPFLLTLAFVLSSFGDAPQYPTTSLNKESGFLKMGEKAPSFVKKDVLGNKVHLKKVLKNSNILLTFLRPAWCPICNARTHELIKYYQEMKAQGFEIIAVYPSTVKELEGYVKDLKIPFTVIADPEEELYRLYGVERSKEKYAQTMKEKKGLEAMNKGMELFEKNGNNYGGSQNVKEPIIPADFVLTKNGQKIQKAHYGAYIGDHVAIEELQDSKIISTTKARF